MRFGETSPDHVGLMLDLSPSGMFLKSSRIYPHQTKIVMSMEIAHGKIIQFEGIVQWAKRVPQALARIMPKNGMGILLTNPPAEYLNFLHAHNAS